MRTANIKDINITYLEYLRRDRGLTQIEVSKALNKCNSYYTGKVNNNMRFTTSDIVQLIQIFGMTNDEILRVLGVDI